MSTQTNLSFTPCPLGSKTNSEKVWDVIKANPGLTARQIIVLMPEIIATSVSATVNYLLKRGLIHVCGAQGFRWTYSTSLEQYDPYAKNGFSEPADEKVLLFINGEVQTAKPALEAHVAAPQKIDIDNLTVREAKELFQRLQGLKEMFA